MYLVVLQRANVDLANVRITSSSERMCYSFALAVPSTKVAAADANTIVFRSLTLTAIVRNNASARKCVEAVNRYY